MSVAGTLASFAAARDARGGVSLHHEGGHVEQHDVLRWLRDADDTDRRMITRCDTPTLDIGCGPGRLTAALAVRGVPALGVDVCRHAVELTRARGACAVRRDVFARLPGEGRWHWALLADGNIGIGGDPERLLRRLADLVRPDGGAVVEVSPADVDHRGSGRLEHRDGRLGPAFPWAVIGAPALGRAAAAAGWRVREQAVDCGRHYVVLRRTATIDPISVSTTSSASVTSRPRP